MKIEKNKTWIKTQKGDDKIISIGKDSIFKINPKEEKLPQYQFDIENNIISKDVLTIPFSYIKLIHLQEGKKYIQVYFGNSKEYNEEHLTVYDEVRKKEIFDYLKDKIPNTTYNFEKFSAIKSAKKPMIACFIALILFVWSLYLAVQIENGYVYELVGNSGRPGITGIILGIANLGVLKVVLIFVPLLFIALFSIIRKLKYRPQIHEIVVTNANNNTTSNNNHISDVLIDN